MAALNEQLKLTGKLRMELRGPDGELKDVREVDNLVVTSGRDWVASRMVGNTAAVMSHMALGSGSAAPVAANTALGTELGRTSLTGTSVSGPSVTYSTTFPAGVGTGAVTEAGLFNAASAGTMLARTTFGVVTKAAGDSLGTTWTITGNAAS